MEQIIKISTKELRDNLAEILERVAIGKKRYLVSKFGRAKVIISPASQVNTTLSTGFVKLKAFGIWKDRNDIKKSAQWVSQTRFIQSKRTEKHG